MSRAFVRNDAPEPMVVIPPRPPLPGPVNYVTPRGMALLREELEQLEARRARLASQEIVTAVHPNRIDMIGALRARKACLECHQGREGTLLGAFRYVLSCDQAVPEPKGTL